MTRRLGCFFEEFGAKEGGLGDEACGVGAGCGRSEACGDGAVERGEAGGGAEA